MVEFFQENWAAILLSLVTAAALGVARGFWAKIKKYRAIIEESKQEKEQKQVVEQLEPIIQEIEDLRAYIREVNLEETRKINLIIASYKYRLIQLCRVYLEQGYMTNGQYDQLLEFYKLYTGLGGNGQAKDYYEKVCALPIKHE